MKALLKARTSALAIFLAILSIGYTFAQNNVVVVPLGGNSSIPGGAVMAFNRETCPIGWQNFNRARGRVIVGLNPGGSLASQVGASLSNGSLPQHNHVWSIYNGSNNTWVTSNEFGGLISLTEWVNGMDTVGTGSYPIAANDSTPQIGYYTGNESAGMPYVQLLYCQST